MAFFGRDDRNPTPRTGVVTPRPTPTPSPGSSRVTHVAAGLVIVGTMHGAERVEIEGKVNGDVRVDGDVVVGPHGFVHGRVEARSVRVEGRVKGDLIASERVEVSASGSTDGDIEAPRVIIAEGAYFKGNVKMGRSASAARDVGGPGREGKP